MNRDQAIRLWASKHHVPLDGARKLMTLVEAAEKVQTDWHNGEASDRQANAACQAVSDQAAKLGYSVNWPGIFPVLVKDGNIIDLPDYDEEP